MALLNPPRSEWATELWFWTPSSLRVWLTGATLVNLLDYDGETRISVAWPTDDGNLWGPIFHRTMVGRLLLLPDGTVTEMDGRGSWVQHWLPVDVEARTMMILQGAKGFDP